MTSVILAACHGARLLISIGATICIGRQLGNSGFGTLSTALAAGGLVMTLSELGLSSAQVVLGARYPRRANQFLKTCAWLMTALGVLGALMIGLLSWWFSHSSALNGVAPWMLLLMLPVLFQAGLLYFSELHASGRTSLAVMIGTSIILVGSITRMVAALLGSTPGQQLALQALETVAGSLWGWCIIAPKVFQWQSWRGTLAASRTLLRQAWKTALQGQAESFFLRVEVLLLGAFGLVSTAGDYSAAMRLHEIGVQLVAYLLVPFTPRLARLQSNKDMSRLTSFMEQGLGLMGLLSWCLMLGLVATGPFILPLLYGDRFETPTTTIFLLALALMPAILFQFNSRAALVLGGTLGNLYALTFISLTKAVILSLLLFFGAGSQQAALVFCLGSWSLWWWSAYRNEACPSLATNQGIGLWGWLISKHARIQLGSWLKEVRRTGDILPT